MSRGTATLGGARLERRGRRRRRRRAGGVAARGRGASWPRSTAPAAASALTPSSRRAARGRRPPDRGRAAAAGGHRRRAGGRAADSDGLVDPTIGRRGDRRRLRPRLRAAPADRPPRPLRRHAGLARRPARPRAHAPCGCRPASRLDLGATAKALAADRAAAPPPRPGAARRARRPRRRHRHRRARAGWRLARRDRRRPSRRAPDATVALTARRRPGHLEHDAAPLAGRRRRLHHIFDPRSGRPAPRRLADRQRRGADLRGREHGEHRRDRARRRGAGLAGAREAFPPASCDRDGTRPRHGRLARSTAAVGLMALWYLSRAHRRGRPSSCSRCRVVLGVVNVERLATPRFAALRHRRLAPHRLAARLRAARLHIATSLLDGVRADPAGRRRHPVRRDLPAALARASARWPSTCSSP